MAEAPQWISAIASVASSSIALTAVLIGISKAKKELDRWREEKRDVKRAEIAGEVLVASLRFLSGLETIVSNFRLQVDEDEATSPYAFEDEVAKRWVRFSETEKKFREAWQLAETYLPDEVSQLLENVSQESNNIWASQKTHFAVPAGSASESFDMGFGSKPKVRLKDLRSKCRQTLRPIAQLEPNAMPKRTSLKAK